LRYFEVLGCCGQRLKGDFNKNHEIASELGITINELADIENNINYILQTYKNKN